MTATGSPAAPDVTPSAPPRRRIRRIVGWLLALLLGPPLLWGGAALLLGRIACNDDWRSPSDGIVVGVSSNGVHCDLVLPAQAAGIDWSRRFPRTDFAAVDERFEWIAIGWGDRGFYLEVPTFADLDLNTAIRAMSGCSTTALHVTWRFNEPTSDERNRRLRLTEVQYRELAALVEAAIVPGATAAAALIPNPGYWPYDRFYEAYGSYSAFATCNEWVASRLRRVGVRAAAWAPFAGDVLRHLPRDQ